MLRLKQYFFAVTPIFCHLLSSVQEVDATMVLLRYTYYGDADLSGNVMLNDFNRFAGHFGTGTKWYQGDFNYGQTVDLTDFNFLAMNFGLQGLGDHLEDGEKVTVEDLINML